MQYPGNPDLSAQAQERVLTTFKQAIQKLHAGGREEAMIALEFLLRLDPQFRPARELHDQLTSGAEEVDLSSIVGELQEATDTKVDQLLVDAVDDFNERRFHKAREKVQQVLRELPGHKEARNLLTQIEDALKTEAQVGQYLVQAREALDRGEPEESANFVMMAQALDPHHPGIVSILASLEEAGAFFRQEPVEAEAPAGLEQPSFETKDFGAVPGASEAEAPSSGEQGFDNIFGEDISSEASWSFEEPAPEPESAPVAEEPVGESLPEGSGVDDLFSADEGSFFESSPVDSPAETGDHIQELLIEGKTAFENGDDLGAIDTWSRIFLSDPGNTEASRLIEGARQRKEEVDRQIDQLILEAEEAITSGRPADARQPLEQVLELRPGDIHALDLLAGLSRPPEEEDAESAATVDSGGESALDDLDIDLFEEGVPAGDAAASGPLNVESVDFEGLMEAVGEAAVQLPEPRAKKKLPVRALALAAVGLLVVALGAWFGARMFAGHRQESARGGIERALADAEELFKGGHPRDAVRLLEHLDVSGPDQMRVSRRLARYKKALLPPTPTPVPDEATQAQTAFDEGRLIEAYTKVQAGLEKHSMDPGLQELRERILAEEPSIGPLTEALSKKEYQTVLGICRTLVEKDPDNAEYREFLERSLFNQAISELRKYNLTEADLRLAELEEINPGDEEVQRIRRFIAKYKTRPADMQLKIFIASLGQR